MRNFAQLRLRFPGIASIWRNGMILTGTQWAEAGLRGVYAVLIARALGPELYGVWSFATTAYTFALAFAFFGLETLIPLRLGKDRDARAFIGTTFLLRLGLLSLAALGVAIYAVAFESEQPIRLALLIVLPALFGRGLVLWARAVFLSLDQNGKAFRMAVILRSIEIALGLTFLAAGGGIFAILLVHTAAWVVEAIWSFRVINRQSLVEMRIVGAELTPILKKGAMLGLTAIGLAALTAGPLILTRYLTNDLEVIGQIALATQIATLVVMGAHGLLSAALPVLARASANSDPRLSQYPFIVVIAVFVLFGIAIPVAYFCGDIVISALIGVRFSEAGSLLAPALLVGGLSVLPVGFVQIFVTQGRLLPGVLSGWLAVGILLLALPILVEISGAHGALYAAALAWGARALSVIFWALLVRSQIVPSGQTGS